MFRTHPNFKSLIPSITNIEKTYEYIVLPLRFQKKFRKRSSPLEQKEWDEKKLKSFKINPKEIDRLYVINKPGTIDDDDESDEYIVRRHYHLVARIDRKGFKNKIYIEMVAFCSLKNGIGTIYVSSDLNLFMNIMFSHFNKKKREKIFDFIKIQDNHHLILFNIDAEICRYKYVPTLHYLCRQVIRENVLLQDFIPSLTPHIRRQLTNYIKFKNAYEDHWHFLNDYMGCGGCKAKKK